MVVNVMLSVPPPMSNAERQRQFRERNPGYYQRLHAKRRAEINARIEARLVATTQVMAAKREPLMLPAPVETIEIPGMNTIPAIGAIPAPSPLPVSRSTDHDSSSHIPFPRV
jgi:hypothetical protein